MNIILLAANTVSNGIALFKPLYWLFGKCMGYLLDLLGNQYFLALIIFTVITRLLLLPLNIKQQKTMARTTRLQPKIQKIQKKYPDPRDRDKLNKEMQELYAREGHNPMQMGCGPMLFQMIFLMGIIGIIYYPIQYIIGAGGFNDASADIQNVILPIYQNLIGDPDAKITYFQLNILENFNVYKEALQTSFPNIFTDGVCADIESYRSGMTMFGLDMTAVPHWKTDEGTFNTLVIIPLLCLVTSLGSSLLSTIIQKKNNPAAGQQMNQMMLMMLMMPIFSFYISFKVTAAVGFYWIISNLVAMLQQIFIFKQYPPRKTQARLMVENTIERRSREENIKKIK
ncbi:MAG: YidC/Oxa1 family membrane protein insertase [Clostridium sp.]|nr:YidC/Oxa1 family membrane protein insertase [Clostridium sp.]